MSAPVYLRPAAPQPIQHAGFGSRVSSTHNCATCTMSAARGSSSAKLARPPSRIVASITPALGVSSKTSRRSSRMLARERRIRSASRTVAPARRGPTKRNCRPSDSDHASSGASRRCYGVVVWTNVHAAKSCQWRLLLRCGERLRQACTGPRRPARVRARGLIDRLRPAIVRPRSGYRLVFF